MSLKKGTNKPTEQLIKKKKQEMGEEDKKDETTKA